MYPPWLGIWLLWLTSVGAYVEAWLFELMLMSSCFVGLMGTGYAVDVGSVVGAPAFL